MSRNVAMSLTIKHVFQQLCNILRTQYGYDGTKRVCFEESVAMALVVLGNGIGNRMV